MRDVIFCERCGRSAPPDIPIRHTAMCDSDDAVKAREKITLTVFLEAAGDLAVQRLRTADSPPGRWGADVLATIRHKSMEWWRKGGTPDSLVDHVMLMPQAELIKSTLHLPARL